MLTRTARSSLLLAFLLTAAILLAGCSKSSTDETTRDANGAVASSGTLGVEKLRVGDCVDVGDAASQQNSEVDAFTGVPCSEPHQAEVFLVDKQFFAKQPADWPGDTVIGEAADKGCLAAFEAYVGKTYEKSGLDFASITPTKDTWSQDDRALVCTVVTPTDDGNDLKKTTGSLKG